MDSTCCPSKTLVLPTTVTHDYALLNSKALVSLGFPLHKNKSLKYYSDILLEWDHVTSNYNKMIVFPEDILLLIQPKKFNDALLKIAF
jgi:hypothetical protein